MAPVRRFCRCPSCVERARVASRARHRVTASDARDFSKSLTQMIRFVTFDALHTLITPRKPIHIQYAEVFSPYLGTLPPDAIARSFKLGVPLSTNLYTTIARDSGNPVRF
jgi:hypothetical protein